MESLILPPYHLIDYTSVALDNLDDFGGDVFVDVVGDRNAVVAGSIHRDGSVNGLKEALFVDAGDEEACFVEGLGSFCRSADADGGEGVAN